MPRSSARSRRGGTLRRDRWRALIAGTCIGALLGGGIHLAGWTSVIAQWRPLQQQAKVQAGDELATGSILLVPLSGDNCRSLVIDNVTWRIRDQGLVDCHTALVSGGVRQLSSARAEVMRAVFGKR